MTKPLHSEAALIYEETGLILDDILSERKYPINYKLGSLGGLFGGAVVYYINSAHGFGPASFAFGKQFMYSMLVGIILLDAMGDLAAYQSKIDEFVEFTGLPILDHMSIGLDGLKNVLFEALERTANKEQVT